VLPETEKLVTHLIPAINVPAGNPKGIKELADLARPGMRIGIARPDSVCVGLYAVEVLEKNGLAQQVKPNIVTHAESCEKTAQLVALGSVDAILGWRVFHYWQPDKIETILLKPQQVPRIGYISIAVSTFCTQKDAAERFIAFLLSDEARSVFRKWHYLVSVEEARQFTLPDTPVGGEWQLPEGW
jgi:molybdate transport system substrate-binding protein